MKYGIERTAQFKKDFKLAEKQEKEADYDGSTGSDSHDQQYAG